MLKRLVNELRCTVSITTTGPVLVKSGRASVCGPDMTPVETYRNGREEVYLPGSSLKGVIRSHLEKICRTLRPGVVCNPFVKTADVAQTQNGHLVCPDFADVACSDKFEVREKGELRVGNDRWRRQKEGELSSTTVYADSCPICRLFGSTSFIGRLSIGDAYLAEGAPRPPLETRDAVGIDRLTGGAAHGAKFELQTVPSGVTFRSDILLRNFECWQVGMLLVAIADMRDGLVRVGSGRSRGLGAVKAEVTELTFHTLAPTPGRGEGEVWGLGKLLSENKRGIYAVRDEDALPITPAPPESTSGLRRVAVFAGNGLPEGAKAQAACAFADLESKAREVFVARLDAWQVSPGMRWPDDWHQQQGGPAHE